MGKITGKPIVTYIGLKRVKPTRSRCIRKLREWRTGFVWGHTRYEEGCPLESFYRLLRCKGAFFAENSIARYTDLLKVVGYSVSEETLQPHTESEYVEATNYCYQGKPVFRIIRSLSLQENEAILTSTATARKKFLRSIRQEAKWNLSPREIQQNERKPMWLLSEKRCIVQYISPQIAASGFIWDY